jgi:hypothetical protein
MSIKAHPLERNLGGLVNSYKGFIAIAAFGNNENTSPYFLKNGKLKTNDDDISPPLPKNNGCFNGGSPVADRANA